MKPSDIIDRAAEEILRPNGWKQGNYGHWTEGEGPVCALGACARVIEQDWLAQDVTSQPIGWTNAIWDKIEEITADFGARGMEAVVNYNDNPGRTALQVAAELFNYANKLREQGR